MRIEIGEPVWSSPAVVDGKLYFGSHDGNVYAFDVSGETIASAK